MVLAAFLPGCTPVTNTIEGPYTDERLTAEQLSAKAELLCQQHRGLSASLPPHPFTTDGCSLWPDNAKQSCCIEHDMTYWCGGSAEDRQRADQQLEACVSRKTSSWAGTLMYVGVRIGGYPWLPFPWRWGYGWNWPYKDKE
jgi:hypothetical protein